MPDMFLHQLSSEKQDDNFNLGSGSTGGRARQLSHIGFLGRIYPFLG